MLSPIFSQKHDGGGHSRSSDSASSVPIARYLLLCLLSGISLLPQVEPAINFKPSQSAAESCRAKLANLEENATKGRSGGNNPVRFSQDEVNSWIALDLSSNYHPCLKKLTIEFNEGKLQGLAAIDFDRLETTSSKFVPKLLSFLFSGIHSLSAKGKLICKGGKGNFQLEQARFDNSTLPNSLVEEIITIVGRKQTPPFDPLQPAQFPYNIQRIDIHYGYALVYQQ
jgi:hypothetical protein